MKEKYYNIAEIFVSLQSEGYHTGTKCVFIRMAGCNLGKELVCDFCDTDYSKKMSIPARHIIEMCKRECENHKLIFGEDINHVVVTGGEPLLQFDEELLNAFLAAGISLVQIETNGTVKLDGNLMSAFVYGDLWITCSPKIANRTIIEAISEIKVVLSDKQLVDEIVKKYDSSSDIYIQPVERNGVMNFQEVYDYILHSPYSLKLSLQTHKIMNIE